jgi:rhodanese-related sulfurtransferase
MLDARANLPNSIPPSNPIGKLTQLPFVGNRLVQTQVPQMSVQHLQQLLAKNATNLLLIDVRYPSEYNIAHLPGEWLLITYPQIKGGSAIPRIKQLLQEKQQANPNEEIQVLILCRAGVRSAHSVFRLQQAGIKATNITGGIDAWRQHIDPSLSNYERKDIPEIRSSSTNMQQNKQRWLSGCGIALAIGAVGAVGAVRYNSDLLRPLIQAGVPLAAASDWPVIGYAIQEASEPIMSVQELKQLIDSKDKNYLLVDVRTPEEYKLSRIPGSVLVPVMDIEQGKGIEEIKSQSEGRKILVYCTSGKRSTRAVLLLKQAGIKGTKVQGGIRAWTEEIDPSLPRNNW